MTYTKIFSNFAIFILSLFLLSGVAHANPALITLTTPSNTYAPGATIPVSIRINTNGSSVITAEIQVTYDSSKVSFVSVNDTGSAFNTPNPIPIETSSGTYIGITNFNFVGTSGSNLFYATINFRANSAGTANFGLTPSTKIFNGNVTNIYSSNGSSGKTVSIQAPTPPPPPPSNPDPTPDPNPEPPPPPPSNPDPTPDPNPEPDTSSPPSNQPRQPQNASNTPSIATDGTVNQPVNTPGNTVADPTNETNEDDEDTDTDETPLGYASSITGSLLKYIFPLILVVGTIVALLLLANSLIKHYRNLKIHQNLSKNTKSTPSSTPELHNTGTIIHPSSESNPLNVDPNQKIEDIERKYSSKK